MFFCQKTPKFQCFFLQNTTIFTSQTPRVCHKTFFCINTHIFCKNKNKKCFFKDFSKKNKQKRLFFRFFSKKHDFLGPKFGPFLGTGTGTKKKISFGHFYLYKRILTPRIHTICVYSSRPDGNRLRLQPEIPLCTFITFWRQQSQVIENKEG